MTTIIVDSALRARLQGHTGLVELRDEDGHSLGHFLPADHNKESCASIPIPFSDEEIARRRQATGGRSLAEIWKSLGRT